MNSASAFQFQKFNIKQEHCAMKIGIDSALLGAWCPITHPNNILDLGCGTGILALMMAQRSQAHIDAIEIENSAYKESLENFKASPYAHRISAFHTAVQDFSPDKRYDIIISNPPYFDATLLSNNNKRNTARHQISLSLEDFITNSKRLLTDNGLLVFILPSQAIDNVSAYAKKHALSIKKRCLVYGKVGKTAKRCLFALQQSPCTTEMEKITIRNTDHKYTDEFKNLTKAFYLPSIFR